MTGWIEPFVHAYGLYGLAADVFLEALGAPVPGETLLVIAAGMASGGVLDIRAVALVAFLAAVLGDNLGYLIGRRYGRQVVLSVGGRVGITEARLEKVERILDHRGWVVVSVARFFPLLRQLNGLAAGTVRMRWTHFLAANIAGAALWVGLWSWIGYRVGGEAHLLPLVWQVLHRFAWVIVPPLLIAMLGFGLWFRRRHTG
ncbi:MAG: DedA family protein [Maritimibacter sp.]|nr:DedA family protein [Maritimibacter sp.]